MNIKTKSQVGVTLLETIIGVAIFAMIAFSVYQGFTVLLATFNASRIRVAATDLANEKLEIIRNMPYDQVGTVGGLPPGIILQSETKSKNGMTFNVVTAIRNIDDPFDGTFGGNPPPNDLSPTDYKLAEISLNCLSCTDQSVFKFTGRVTSKSGSEISNTNGALFIQAINASGQPVTGATVHIVNSTVLPAVDITDTTGIDGFLRVLDVPPANTSYNITVSKSGYTIDQTYPATPENPNPTKPPLTVASLSVTQSTFSIDKVSTLNVSSLTEVCAAVPSMNFTLTGGKLIGTTPDIPKFSQSYVTDGAGGKSVTGLEWDNYKMVFVNTVHDIAGTIPLLPITLAPDSTQNFKMIMKQKNPKALMVTVKDAASGLPLSGASVNLSFGTFNQTLATGRGFLSQTDWSGGGGQAMFINPSQYFSQDGNIENTSPAGEIKLRQIATSTYAGAGLLESSTFDTGSPSNFFSILWTPQSQPPDTGPNSVKFQLASATTSSPTSWIFKGPDGTAASFYTTSNTNINVIHNGDRYIRYKAYLETASTTFTPVVSDVSLVFASDCVPPGQVFWSGLAAATYNVTITRSGYQTINDVVTVNQDWKESVFLMNPL